VEGLDEREARLRGHVRHALGFGRVGGHGFLAQHMLTGSQRPNAPLAVQAVGQWIVDRIDLGIGEQVIIRLMNTRDRVL
jgi:hypothetical protein